MTPVSNEVAMKLMDALERMVALYEGEFDIVGGRPDWLVEALNLRFSTLSPTVSPEPSSSEPVAWKPGSCASCNGTGDLGGNPSYGVCPDCDGTGIYPPKSTLSPTVSQPIEAQPIHPLPMPKYDFQGNEPTLSQPGTGEEVERVARAIAFAGRMEHDMSADADEFWAHTGEDSRERYRAMAREALTTINGGENER